VIDLYPFSSKNAIVPAGVPELVPTVAASVTIWLVTGWLGLTLTATSESGVVGPSTTVPVTVCTSPLSWYSILIF
jgi:hypothetical protein